MNDAAAIYFQFGLVLTTAQWRRRRDCSKNYALVEDCAEINVLSSLRILLEMIVCLASRTVANVDSQRR